MNRQSTDPRYEFRVFGHEFGQLINTLLASSPRKRREAFAKAALSLSEMAPEPRDEGLQTYLLAAGGQSCSIKVRDHQLDTKVLLRHQQGLERWQPHLQLAFPLTAAFLHEFLFAWLAIEPPHLQRTQYTEAQFWQELIAPHPALYAVQVHKRRRCFTINGCALEMTALTINDFYHTHTVAVEAAEAEKVLATITLLGLHTFVNTNYLMGLSQVVGLDAPEARTWSNPAPVWAPALKPPASPELVLVC